MAHWSEFLIGLDACGEAQRWAQTQPDAATAWATCERTDWMTWIACRLDLEATRPALYACADHAVRVYAPRAFDAAAEKLSGETQRSLREWAGCCAICRR